MKGKFIQKLRHDLEEANIIQEQAMSALRKKHSDAVAELTEQLEAVQKIRAKLEKDKALIHREAEELQSQMDIEAKQVENIKSRPSPGELENLETKR